MPVLALILVMQFVVSVKAGLVNHTQGVANVVEGEMARQGHGIRTSEDGYVEVLLTPGSFLRLGEDSEAVLDGVELDNVSLRVVHGAAIVEVLQINKAYPLHVTTGKLRVDILKAGVYRFLDGTATVVEGQLRAESGKTYGKGWQVAFNGQISAKKTGKLGSMRLDIYSQARSAEIARSNLSMASQVRQVSGPSNYWLYDPGFGMYTFMPFGNFRSPYGYRYYAPRRVDHSDYANNSRSGGYSGPGPSTPTPGSGNSNAGNTNSGNTNSGNGGGQGGGGGNAAPAPYIPPPAPVVNPPVSEPTQRIEQLPAASQQ